MPQASRVLPCDLPLDQFRQRMLDALRARGWAELPAQQHDFGVARRGARAWVKLRYTERGVEVAVKAKLPLLGAKARWEEVWEAARTAQQGAARGEAASDEPPRGS